MSTNGAQTIELIAINTIAGCEDTTSRQFEVKPFVLTNLMGDTICQGDTALISAGANGIGVDWVWSPGQSLLSPNSAETKAIPIQTTEYTVNGIQQSGCEASGKARVFVIEPFGGTLEWDTSVVKGSLVTLNIPQFDSSYNYMWMPDIGLSCTNCTNPQFTADTSITYTLILSDEFDCFQTMIRYKINVSPTEIKLPNVFTPNGDGKNDNFQIFVVGGGINDIGILKFKVYSRWGQLVYDNGDLQKGWDGYFKGKPCPMDVYVYVIEVGYFNGTYGNYTGEITLVR
jgi:gliding motility-associated-like protein